MLDVRREVVRRMESSCSKTFKEKLLDVRREVVLRRGERSGSRRMKKSELDV